jgi:hypothetical protein
MRIRQVRGPRLRRISTGGLDEAIPNSVADKMCDVMTVELLHQSSPVRIDGLGTDCQPFGDFLCREALGDQLQYLAMARR